MATVVEKFTSTYVSPSLWNSEVLRIQESKASFDNMTVSNLLNFGQKNMHDYLDFLTPHYFLECELILWNFSSNCFVSAKGELF